MLMRFSSIIRLPSAIASALTSFSTSSPYSDFPTKAPSAIEIGRPIIPVPGIPTPIAFFSTLSLKRTSIFSGIVPSVSFAFATANATATGSVHPIAGTTSFLIRSIICFLSVASIQKNFLQK